MEDKEKPDNLGCGCMSIVVDFLIILNGFLWYFDHHCDYSIGVLWNDLVNNPLYIVFVLLIIIKIIFSIYLLLK